MENPAGESHDGGLRLDFDRRLKPEFHAPRITSDAGLLACRERAAALSLGAMAGDVLAGRNGHHALDCRRQGCRGPCGISKPDRPH